MTRENLNPKRIAISNTIPSEIIYAAGEVVCDLNNSFVTSGASEAWIDEAEYNGLPKSLCAWIKGVYTACLIEQPDAFIAVTEGDCSNTKGLQQLLTLKGIPNIEFAFPYDRCRQKLEGSLKQLMQVFNVSESQVTATWKTLNSIRALGVIVDQLTYTTYQVTGFENHLSLVSFSDFCGNPSSFKNQLENLIVEATTRPPNPPLVRLAYLGVPPMYGDLYHYVETQGAGIVFNEVQRQFMMPDYHEATSLVDQYLAYTYPYDIWHRIKAIKKALAQRQIDGIIHYTQAFCHHSLDDMVLRTAFDVPILTLEGDKAQQLDSRAKLRLEAYIDMLKDQKSLSQEQFHSHSQNAEQQKSEPQNKEEAITCKQSV